MTVTARCLVFTSLLLIVGAYRYVVASLPFPIRPMAYVVGFGGGRERGLRMT